MLVRAATSAMYCRLLFMVCSALGVCEAAMPHPKTSPSSVVTVSYTHLTLPTTSRV